MSEALFSNNANTTVSAAISPVAVSVTVAPGTGALFPNPGANQYFVASFTDALTGLLTEIVHVTARTGDTMTIVRGQEGTAAQNWSIGDFFAQLVTAGEAGLFAQPDDLQAQAGNYAEDTGAGGANVVDITTTPTPPDFAHTEGSVFRIAKGSLANTGAVVINFGGGPSGGAIVLPGGAALTGGELAATGIFTVVGDGTGNFELQSLAGAGGGGVPPTRMISTINGLTGGGDLSANRTLQPVYGTVANTVCQGNDSRLIGGGVFISASVAITLGGGSAFAHGLTLIGGAVAPSLIMAYLINVASEGGYSPNEVVALPSNTGSRDGVVWGNTTQIGFALENSGINIVPKGGGSQFAITPSKWQIFMTARP